MKPVTAIGGMMRYPLDMADPLRVIALNNASEVETSRLDQAKFARLLAVATYAHAIGEGPDGFLFAMDETSAYDNRNFAWFKARHERFVYVDRIVVAAPARGRGLARLLYDDLFATMQASGCKVIGCEINIHPANPRSDAFHASLDFREVGQADIGLDGKRVRYLVKTL